VQRVADRLKPGCSPATINRHIFTPITSVMSFAARAKMCAPVVLLRPKGHDKAPKLETPSEEWFNVVLPRLSPQVRACVLAITLHGLRIAEAIERTPEDLDPKTWRLSIPDTKTGDPVDMPLSKPVIEAVREMWTEQRREDAERKAEGKPPLRRKWLFGTCHRSNIRRAVNAACKDAGVPTYGLHAIGRHSFSVRVLKDGKSVKFLMAAGRWKSPKMPMVRYGHLERSEVNEAVLEIASKWEDGAKLGAVQRMRRA
jgi:integrase